MRHNVGQITAMVLITVCVSLSGWADTYDDFSSGDLSKWTYTPSSTGLEPQVAGGEMFWGNGSNTSWQGGTLVSTQTGFDLLSSSTSTVQMTIADIVPRDSADTSFDSFGFGWQDESGDVAIFRYNWRADSTNNNAALQMLYIPNGGSQQLLGGNAWFAGYPIENGDILKLVYLRDDNRLEVYRERSGTETFIFGRTSTLLTNLTGNARLYLMLNEEGLGASVTVDDISTTPGATTGPVVLYQDTFGTDGSLSGRSVETGFGTLWQAHAEMMSSNGVALPGATAAAKVAALPLTPETDKIYTLSADINAISNSWVALGFLSETNSATIPGNGFFFSYVDEQSPWMYTQPNGNVATFTGPTAGGQEVFAGMGSNGTLKVELNTSEANWTATWYFNTIPLRTNTYSGSLNITHVAFGGNPVSISEVDNFTLSVSSTLSAYEQWAAGWGADIGSQTNDFDGDGLNNLAEYGLGGDPTDAASQGIAPVSMITQDGGTNWFTYVYPERSDLGSGIAYYLEVTDDLVEPSWTNAGYFTTGTGTIDADFDAVTNRISTETKARQFIRLIIEAL